MSASNTNRYIFLRENHEGTPLEFDPQESGCLASYHLSYIEDVLREFDNQLPDQGFIIYITMWNIDQLPEYGDNVIAIVLLDEFNRELRYRSKVKAIYRTCGFKPTVWNNLQHGSINEKLANVLAYGRDLYRDGLDGRIRTTILKAVGTKFAPIYAIPLGYFADQPAEFIPFNQREYLLSFAGSVQHRVNKPIFPSPKEQTRNRMLEALSVLKDNNPDLPINLRQTSNFKSSIASTFNYSQEMMSSQFCLVPRGTTLETYRFYEAIRFGCIPIMEVVPDVEFYEDAPIVKLEHWSDLEETILSLLAQPDVLDKMHTDALEWWRDKCDSKIIADRMVKQLS
ncbi:exostosin domain-containing protein [Vibrio sp. WJH972]